MKVIDHCTLQGKFCLKNTLSFSNLPIFILSFWETTCVNKRGLRELLEFLIHVDLLDYALFVAHLAKKFINTCMQPPVFYNIKNGKYIEILERNS